MEQHDWPGNVREPENVIRRATALKKCRGNRKQAVRVLGSGEATLYRKLKRYELNTDLSARPLSK